MIRIRCTPVVGIQLLIFKRLAHGDFEVPCIDLPRNKVRPIRLLSVGGDVVEGTGVDGL